MVIRMFLEMMEMIEKQMKVLMISILIMISMDIDGGDEGGDVEVGEVHGAWHRTPSPLSKV